MPFWIQGWIESSTGKIDAETIWFPTVNLSPLIDTGDAVSELLFGLSKRCRSDKELLEKSLFVDRGLPPGVSLKIKAEKLDYDKSPGECAGYTYASLNEIRNSGFEISEYPKSDWVVVFAMMHAMLDDPRFETENLRLVTWYNW